MSEYQTWLLKQREIAEEAVKLIERYNLRAVVLSTEKGSPFVRLFLPDKTLDYTIKSIKSRFSKSVWLCKEKDFKITNNYLIYLRKENRFMMATGAEIDKDYESRDSDYGEGKVVVVSIETFRPAIGYFKTLAKSYEAKKQKRMSDWI